MFVLWMGSIKAGVHTCRGRPPSFSRELTQPQQGHQPIGLSASFKGSVPPGPLLTLGLAAHRTTAMTGTWPLVARQAIRRHTRAILNTENFPQNACPCSPSAQPCLAKNTHPSPRPVPLSLQGDFGDNRLPWSPLQACVSSPPQDTLASTPTDDL